MSGLAEALRACQRVLDDKGGTTAADWIAAEAAARAALAAHDAEPDPADYCDPRHYSPEQLRGALQCVHNLAGDYLRGAWRGGSMEWDDLDATAGAARSELPELFSGDAALYWAREQFDRQDWEEEADEGNTTADYETWLREQVAIGTEEFPS